MLRPLTDAEVHAAVELATKAPSLHNSQPWLFRRVAGGTIELRSDPTRALHASDPTGRGARQACGAALLNLRLALAAANRQAEVTLLPAPGDPTLLARLDLTGDRPASDDELALAAAIPRRHSQRGPFHDALVPMPHHSPLVGAAAAEASVLVLVTDPGDVADIADVVHAATTTLSRQEGYLDELRAWLRPDASGPDGIPPAAAGPAPAPHELLERRDFGGKPALENRRYENRPLVGVLGSFGDSPLAQVRAGEALQRVLLTATLRGLAVSMFSQPVEVPEARQRLGALIGRLAVPQMVLRIGFGTPGPATPRRPTHDVVERAADIR